MRNLLPGLVIAVVTVAVSATGGLVTDSGMDWYRTLDLPSFTPPGSFIGMVWTAIYIMAAVAAWLIWKQRNPDRIRYWLIGLLIANAVLNVLWTMLFFGIHQLGLSVIEMIVLNLINLAIIVLCWNRLRAASLLFVPYFAWVCFATYLAITIWRLNS